MKKFTANLLLLAYLALGTGAVGYLHNLQHAAEDAREDAIAVASGQAVEPHHHDEGNCPIHASLFFAFFFGGWIWLLRLVGLFIAFVVLAHICVVHLIPALRICCRGPPALCTSR